MEDKKLMMRDVGADEGVADDNDGAMMVMVMTVDDDDVEALGF